jgi:hypothetical protein
MAACCFAQRSATHSPLKPKARVGNTRVGDVRFGSKADIPQRKGNVRFTPKSGHWLGPLGMSALCQKRTSDLSIISSPSAVHAGGSRGYAWPTRILDRNQCRSCAYNSNFEAGHGEVSHAVSPNQAQEALSKLSPEERAAFVKMLQDRAATRGVTLPRQVAPEPKELGQVLTDLHTKPGQLRDMLGGGAAQSQGQASGASAITDILTSPMAKAVLAGIAAMVVKRVMGQSRTV